MLKLETGYKSLSMLGTMRLQLRLRAPREAAEKVLQLTGPLLSMSAHLLPGVGFSASTPLSKHCPAPRHCKPRLAGANTIIKAPIVQHPCKGFTLMALWGQGIAESQLTHKGARVKLCSFDSLRAREHVCSANRQQPGEQCSIRIPHKESSVHRASEEAAPEGDAVLPGGLPDDEVPSCEVE